MKKVLIITYYWPPSGGAGVQRWLKFSKYLPQYGWEPVILTVDPEYATYPAFDGSLGKDIPDSLKVIRTKATDWFRFYARDKSKVPSAGFATNADNSLKGKISRFIRGNFFIPDPRKGWNRFAFKEACELINNEGIKHLITTSPPHSTQLIGLRLKKKFPEITWITDFRDTWTDIYYYDLFFPTRLARSIDAGYEKKVLRNANYIVTVGNNLADVFSSKTPEAGPKIKIISNGYDDDDFAGILPEEPARFTITYVGTISGSYPIKPFLDALSIVQKDGKKFLLRFAGNIPESFRSLAVSILGESSTEFIPYIEHTAAIKLISASSMLLLLIPDTPKNKAITPGKVFEYIATGKNVLYIGPEEGDAAFHLRRCGQEGIFNGENTIEISDFIAHSIENEKHSNWMGFPEYSRKNLTAGICRILDR